jgi:hypothetical protein
MPTLQEDHKQPKIVLNLQDSWQGSIMPPMLMFLLISKVGSFTSSFSNSSLECSEEALLL